MDTPLAKVKGVGPSTERQLKYRGIKSAEDLAAIAVDNLAAMPNFDMDKATTLKQAAMELLGNGGDHTPAEPAAVTPVTTAKSADSNTKTTAAPAKAKRTKPAPTATTEQTATAEPAAPAPARSRASKSQDQSTPAKSEAGSDTGESVTKPQASKKAKVVIPAVAPVAATKPAKTGTMAVFCDFENIVLGTRAARYPAFDVSKVLSTLLPKGNIAVRKVYGDWSSHKDFKTALHAAAFELIEIPTIPQSNQNPADIRMVVDALDLCYTKPHINTFVIISGNSDFTSLANKLRENNKTVIGIGVKKTTDITLANNCNEFIYYDDLLEPAAKKATSRQQNSNVDSKPKPKTNKKPILT